METLFDMGNLALFGIPLAGIFSLLMVFLSGKFTSKSPSKEEKKQEKVIRDIRVKNIRERQKEIDTVVKVIENEGKVSENTKKEIETIMEDTVKKIGALEEVNSISDLWEQFK